MMRGTFARQSGVSQGGLALCFALGAALACFPASAAADSGAALPPMRRFALVMGANGGGESLPRLRYAASDARSFASLLTELGGVRDDDLVLLMEPGLQSFRGAAERLRASAVAANSAGQRCEFVLYYSGHSDDEGLLLGREKLGYSDLRAAIERVPAAVRVAILDSCSSGSLTRTKGGAARPAFLFDASTDMEGHAYITSSSEAEAAQESDKIGGSFFTHYLVSALRGAADSSGEGKVTLNEAYAYAFRETLASTENTQYGPQHPAYEISLTGSGDLVFTDLRSSSSGLSFDEGIAGSVYVRDAKGDLAVELDKAAGERVDIGLPPGKYTVSLIQGGTRSQADIAVYSGGRARLVAGNFKAVAQDATTARGLEVVAAEPSSAILEPEAESPPSIANIAIAPELTANVAGFRVALDMTLLPDFSQGLFNSAEDKDIALSMLWGGARDVRGIQMSSLLNAASGDLVGFQFAFGANAVRGEATGLQLSPGVNLAYGGFQGVQLSGAVNWAAGDARGVQVGLVNVAQRLTGVQVGLVNISKRIDGAPIGLVNIEEEEGEFAAQAWYESATHLRAGFAWGTHLMYSLASFGVDAADSGLVRPSLGAGLGGRLALGSFYGNADLSWRWVFGMVGVGPSSRLAGRVLAGFPNKNAGVMLGLELEGFMPGLSREDDASPVSSFRVEPRFMIGARL